MNKEEFIIDSFFKTIPLLMHLHYQWDVSSSLRKVSRETFFNDKVPNESLAFYNIDRFMGRDARGMTAIKPRYPLTAFNTLHKHFHCVSRSLFRFNPVFADYHPTTPLLRTLEDFKSAIVTRMVNSRGYLWRVIRNGHIVREPSITFDRRDRVDHLLECDNGEVGRAIISVPELRITDVMRYIVLAGDPIDFLRGVLRYRDILLPHRDDLPLKKLHTQLSYAFDHHCFLFNSGFHRIFQDLDSLVGVIDAEEEFHGVKMDIFSAIAKTHQSAIPVESHTWRYVDERIIECYELLMGEMIAFHHRYEHLNDELPTPLYDLPLRIFPHGCSPLHWLINYGSVNAAEFLISKRDIVSLINISYAFHPAESKTTPMAYCRLIYPTLVSEPKKRIVRIMWSLFKANGFDNIISKEQYEEQLARHGMGHVHEVIIRQEGHDVSRIVPFDFYGKLPEDDRFNEQNTMARLSFEEDNRQLLEVGGNHIIPDEM